MVDAEKSGVLFTSHPSTGAATMIVEAAWGLGEAVVSGAVSPDNYVLDRNSGEVLEVTVAEKKLRFDRDPETGETEERPVAEELRTERVLDDEELAELREVGERIEDHYGAPQDVEWSMLDGDVYLLQSRPITTIDRAGSIETATAGEEIADGNGSTQETILTSGLGASPGIASGEVRVVSSLDQLDKVAAGDIIVTGMTTPDMVPAMKRAAGIVTDEGGMTSHASIVSRELGVPAVVGTDDATRRLVDGQVVTIDGDRGSVVEGRIAAAETSEPVEEARPKTPVKPMTATEVKVNVSIPEAAERAAATGADGVGLLRLEHLVLSTGPGAVHRRRGGEGLRRRDNPGRTDSRRRVLSTTRQGQDARCPYRRVPAARGGRRRARGAQPDAGLPGDQALARPSGRVRPRARGVRPPLRHGVR